MESLLCQLRERKVEYDRRGGRRKGSGISEGPLTTTTAATSAGPSDGLSSGLPSSVVATPSASKINAISVTALSSSAGTAAEGVMAMLDSYIEQLYDENIQVELDATRMILSLARNQDHLEELLSHGMS